MQIVKRCGGSRNGGGKGGKGVVGKRKGERENALSQAICGVSRVVSLARSAPLKSRAAPLPFLRAPAVN